MCGKNKCICAFLVGMVSLCLLSACTVNGNDMDMESRKENDLVEHESSSGTLPSEIDNAGQQVTESTGNEQSSDTASKQDEEISSGMEDRYKAILLGNEDFISIEFKDRRKLNIENIKEVVSSEDWVTAKVTKFTIIDLDGNGENELILWIQANGHSDYGFEILFYQDQEVYGFTLTAKGFMNPKTDGTFETFGGIEDSDNFFEVGRLIISEKGYKVVDASDSGSQVSKPDLGWYDLTPENVELVFEKQGFSSESLPSGMEDRYKAILLGNEDFVRIDYRGEDKSLNIKNIKKLVSADDVAAEVTKFAIIDLDGNGENELVLWIQWNGDSVYGFEILFYQDQEVYGFTLPAKGFMNPKTDGTFETFGGIEDSDDFFGVGRLIISEKGYKVVDASDSGSQVSKPDLGWYDLTPENVELAFEKQGFSSESLPSGMEDRYKAILLGNEDFVNIWSNWLSHGERRLNIENIKEVVSSEDWVTAEVTKFTIIDLDGNGENELVLWIQANGHSDYGYEILFYQDQEVYGFTLTYRQFLQLKTDGTFEASAGAGDTGVYKLQLYEGGYMVEEVCNEHQGNKPDVEWYDLTEDNVELVFENK